MHDFCNFNEILFQLRKCKLMWWLEIIYYMIQSFENMLDFFQISFEEL
jgi:hypothetical protein